MRLNSSRKPISQIEKYPVTRIQRPIAGLLVTDFHNYTFF